MGENGLRPEYQAILDYVWTRGIPTSITSNGLSIDALADDAVKRLSVECSLDYPTERDHDRFRGTGNGRWVTRTLERSASLSVPITVRR